MFPAGSREVRLSGPGSGRPGDGLSFKASVLGNGKAVAGSLLRFSVSKPDGKEIMACRQFELSGKEPLAIAWPVALSDRPGAYTVTVTELLSGKTGSCAVTVKQGKE